MSLRKSSDHFKFENIDFFKKNFDNQSDLKILKSILRFIKQEVMQFRGIS